MSSRTVRSRPACVIASTPRRSTSKRRKGQTPGTLADARSLSQGQTTKRRSRGIDALVVRPPSEPAPEPGSSSGS
jgi:hypothetical protein